MSRRSADAVRVRLTALDIYLPGAWAMDSVDVPD